MSILLRVCTVVGAWFLLGLLLMLAAIAITAAWQRLSTRRCALCRVRCERLERCRFGKVCANCQDAVFRLYHYRVPRLSDEQARRILRNLWRDDPLEGEGRRNG